MAAVKGKRGRGEAGRGRGEASKCGRGKMGRVERLEEGEEQNGGGSRM